MPPTELFMSSKKDSLENKMQSIVLTFDDGTTALFIGKAVCHPGDTRRYSVKFTIPKDMPEGLSFIK